MKEENNRPLNQQLRKNSMWFSGTTLTLEASSPRDKDASRSGVYTATEIGTTDSHLQAYSFNFTEFHSLKEGERGSDSSIPAAAAAGIALRVPAQEAGPHLRGRFTRGNAGIAAPGALPCRPSPAQLPPHKVAGPRAQTPRGTAAPTLTCSAAPPHPDPRRPHPRSRTRPGRPRPAAQAQSPVRPPPAAAWPGGRSGPLWLGARPRNVRPSARRAARPGGRPLPLCAPEPGQGRGAERLLRRQGAVLLAAMAALMASLARPSRRGPAGLGTALRREAAPCGRGWPGTQVAGVPLGAGQRGRFHLECAA